MVNKVLLIRRISVCYHNRFGGICPACKATRCFISRSLPWLQGERLRYHKCECGRTFTSIEDEMPLPADIELPDIEPVVEPVPVGKPIEKEMGMSAALACKVSKNRKKKNKKH